ncbi:hypothetical protein GCM10009554_25780 [Kribbella koreensis]|uniref:DUF4383 domain-containing protein n=3 Tax=Kribbellaceae TaxID=2726069 RepID=A0ABP6W6L5_9ACTN
MAGGALVLAWTGFVVHNFADLPGQTFVSPETLLPSLGFVGIAVLWLTGAHRAAVWAALVWGGLHLVGGAFLSVLPLPILPFDPEQSLRHYLFHVLYGVTQLPLLLVAWRSRRTDGLPDRPGVLNDRT